MYGFIYITTNLINHKQYIGQKTIKNDSTDDTYLGSGKLIRQAISKYGRENFVREILDYAQSQEELDFLEEYYIELNQATKSPFFYNIAQGGRGGNKFAGWTEEERIKFSLECSIRTRGENNPRYGVKLTDEQRQRLSEIHSNPKLKQRYQTEEFRQKISEVTKGEKNGMYGKKHSEESKRKMSLNSKGKLTGEKNGNYGNRGDKAKNGKSVYKYEDKERTIIIKKYSTVRLVLEELNIKGHSKLMEAIRTGTKYRDYYWGR